MCLSKHLGFIVFALCLAAMPGCDSAEFEGFSDLSEILGLPDSTADDCGLDDDDDVGLADDDEDEDCGATETPRTVPDFAAARFTNPAQIDNVYFPLVVSTKKTFNADTADGVEEIIVEVLDETRDVMGVKCRVVRDRVFLAGDLIEDTHDFYAQDDDGNVWYMGEEVDNYNYDHNGGLIDITHEGAWEAGKDVAGLGSNAQPGYIMKAMPMPGDSYHQEFYMGEAEDMGEVVALNVPVTLNNGTTYSCLQTRDFSPLDPALNEHKFYASGVGVVLEEPVGGGERVELVEVSP